MDDQWKIVSDGTIRGTTIVTPSGENVSASITGFDVVCRADGTIAVQLYLFPGVSLDLSIDAEDVTIHGDT